MRGRAPEMNLSKAILRGTRWQFASTVAVSLFQLGIAMILARMLAPMDFGLVAIGFALTEVLSVLGEFGVAAAVARCYPPNSRLVWAALRSCALLGLIMISLSLVLGLVIQTLWYKPNLAAVVVSLAAGGVVANLGSVFQAIAESSLDFRRIAIVDFFTYLIGSVGVSVPLAYFGMAHWALVLGYLVQVTARAVAHCPLLFRLPCSTLTKEHRPELVAFGGKLTAARILNAGVNQIDKLVLARCTDATSVGLYSRPTSLMAQLNVGIGSIYDRVLYPAFARLHAVSSSVLPAHFLRSVACIALLLTPLAVLISLKARVIVLMVFGGQWEGAVGVLRWSALALPGLAVVRICDTLSRALGQPGRSVRLKAVYLVMLVPAALLGVKYGVSGVAAVLCLVASLMGLVQVFDATHTAGGSRRELLMMMGRAAPVCLALVLGTLGVSEVTGMLARIHPSLDLAAILLGEPVLCLGILAVDSRFGTRLVPWLLEPFRAQFPAALERLLGLA